MIGTEAATLLVHALVVGLLVGTVAALTRGR